MTHSIRSIDANDTHEIELVASRMRATLVEVLGNERGEAMYSMEWLIDRVRFHLDPKRSTGDVFILCENNLICGHAITRIEKIGETPIGYFSTIYVAPEYRRRSFATALMHHVEEWCRKQRLEQVIYNTAFDNQNLLTLFQKHGYKITAEENHMVQLTKTL